jgi:hypothetical protein
MKLILPGLVLLTSFGAAQDNLGASVSNSYINKEFVSKIKKGQRTWTPFEPDKNPFRFKTDKEISKMLGLKDPTAGSIFSKMFKRKGTPAIKKTL